MTKRRKKRAAAKLHKWRKKARDAGWVSRHPKYPIRWLYEDFPWGNIGI